MSLLSDIFGGKKKPEAPKPKRRRDDKVSVNNAITLEEMTKERICEILDLADIKGPMVCVVKARKLMCEWTTRVGERGAYEKRQFLMKQMRQLGDITIVEDED